MTSEDSKFISDLYYEHHSRLFIHAYAMLGQQSLAEVAVQEAFLIACKNLKKVRKSENPVGWMKKTVEHTALHILREKKRNKALVLSLESLASGNEPADTEKSDFELKEYCQKVVSQEDFAFFLRIAVNGCTYVEEAQKMNISLSACYKRFERIRSKLQKAVQQNMESGIPCKK